MGEIVKSKVLSNGKMVYSVAVDAEEFLNLRNRIKNIGLFSTDLFSEEAQIIKRGREGVTKYFNIPFSLRFRKTKGCKAVLYQKLETSAKVFYVYVLNKE